MPQKVLHEVLLSLENDKTLSQSMIVCCGARLLSIEPATPQTAGEDEDSGVPMWVFIVAGVAGFVVLCLFATIAIACTCRRKSSSYEGGKHGVENGGFK